jgi:hypothetical protein
VCWHGRPPLVLWQLNTVLLLDYFDHCTDWHRHLTPFLVAAADHAGLCAHAEEPPEEDEEVNGATQTRRPPRIAMNIVQPYVYLIGRPFGAPQ